jgi:hypothetical protein
LNANTAIEIAVYGGVIPAVAALVALFAIGYLWPAAAARRYQAGLAFALAVFVGYVALPSTKTLEPSQFWEWIPLLGLVAAFVGGLTRADGVIRGERLAAIYLFALVSAWLLVPRWPELVPTWPAQVAMWAIGFTLLVAVLTPLSDDRLPGQLLPFWLLCAATAVSLLVLSDVSETFGRLAALPAGALTGCGIAAISRKTSIDWRSLALPYAVVVGGWAYVGAVYPTSPLWLLLAVPAAPLALWICFLSPFDRLRGFAAVAVQAACVLVPLFIVVAVLIARAGSSGEDW